MSSPLGFEPLISPYHLNFLLKQCTKLLLVITTRLKRLICPMCSTYKSNINVTTQISDITTIVGLTNTFYPLPCSWHKWFKRYFGCTEHLPLFHDNYMETWSLEIYKYPRARGFGFQYSISTMIQSCGDQMPTSSIPKGLQASAHVHVIWVRVLAHLGSDFVMVQLKTLFAMIFSG